MVEDLKAYLSRFDEKKIVDLTELKVESILAAQESSVEESGITDSSEDNQATPPVNEKETLSFIRRIIADEMNIDIDDIAGLVDQRELGMDSLMTILIK